MDLFFDYFSNGFGRDSRAVAVPCRPPGTHLFWVVPSRFLGVDPAGRQALIGGSGMSEAVQILENGRMDWFELPGLVFRAPSRVGQTSEQGQSELVMRSK